MNNISKSVTLLFTAAMGSTACGPASIVGLGGGGSSSSSTAERTARVSFVQSSSDVTEATFAHSIEVKLELQATGPLSDGLVLDFIVLDDVFSGVAGQDFGSPVSLTIPAGATHGSVHPLALQILDDTLVEGPNPELVQLRLDDVNWLGGAPTNGVSARLGTTRQHSVRIFDDEPSIHRASVGALGAQTNLDSIFPVLSGDARHVAFASLASNLVAGDTNGTWDVFLHDRVAAQTTRVSLGVGGTQTDLESVDPAISSDGTHVAFASSATNLISDDTNGRRDIFLFDRTNGSVTRVSVGSTGEQGDEDSRLPALSADGSVVAFTSPATTLVAGDSNAVNDVFVRDMQSGITTRISVGNSGVEGNDASSRCAISASGRFVAFESAASNLVAGDTNGAVDIFLRDRTAGTTTRISLGSTGTQANDASSTPSLSPDGRFVAFASVATNLSTGDTNDESDIFVHNRQTASTTRVSRGLAGTLANGPSLDPVLAAGGSIVAFGSRASNLVVNDTNNRFDVFVHHIASASTVRASVSTTGVQGAFQSQYPTLSSDGRFVAFYSDAPNLIPNDTNAAGDAFVAAVAFDAGVFQTSFTSPTTEEATPRLRIEASSDGLRVTLEGARAGTLAALCATATLEESAGCDLNPPSAGAALLGLHRVATFVVESDEITQITLDHATHEPSQRTYRVMLRAPDGTYQISNSAQATRVR